MKIIAVFLAVVAVAYAEAEADPQVLVNPRMPGRPSGFYYHVQTYDTPKTPASTVPLVANADGTQVVPTAYNTYNPYYYNTGYAGLPWTGAYGYPGYNNWYGYNGLNPYYGYNNWYGNRNWYSNWYGAPRVIAGTPAATAATSSA